MNARFGAKSPILMPTNFTTYMVCCMNCVYICARYYMLIRVTEFNCESLDHYKAHLGRLTVKVQIRSILLVGINCAKCIIRNLIGIIQV